MRAFWVFVLALGCDQGVKPTPKEAPKPVTTQPPPPPPPAPRPPVAEDLAEYTKDLGLGEKLVATIQTSRGAMTCELYGDKAPMTVANFIGLARGLKPWTDPKTGEVRTRTPFYDGLTFHRVIPGFMIQGGDPLGVGRGGPGYNFNDEIWDGADIHPGVLAMANAGTRGGQGTNGSQFFIMEDGSRPDLNAKHTVFGECAPMNVIRAIARVERDEMDKPFEPVTITKVTISRGQP